ncbi:phytanoyl-CoA dioxygenase family protein [Rhizobium rhizogenes]|nr:phytanoyl-CoA dioxygenase family protein [Rhizobium rhizogenes]QTG09993.1 phytanoyl-CoA dioxygenase family protein [Rhizobium rhizogenes]
MSASIPSFQPLSSLQVQQFQQFGWVHLPAFFNEEATAMIQQWTSEITAMPEVPGRHMVYYEQSLLEPSQRVIQRIENFCPHHSAFDSICRTGPLADAVSQVLGNDAVLFKDKINFKMAGGAGFEAHQDQQAGWSRYAPLFVTALVCIDKATVENGCLEMAQIRRLHKLIAPEWRPINAEEMSDFELVPVPTEPGDVILFDSFAPHASKPNYTSSQRRMLYLTYNAVEDGDHRKVYFDEKRANFPPDIEREPGREYTFKV